MKKLLNLDQNLLIISLNSTILATLFMISLTFSALFRSDCLVWESKEQNCFLDTLHFTHNASFKRDCVAHVCVTEIIFSFPFRAEENLHIDTMNQIFQYNLKAFRFVACIVMAWLHRDAHVFVSLLDVCKYAVVF